MAINKISEFPKVTPSAEDKILIEKNGEGGHINLSEMPISTPVEKKISDVQKDLNDRITALAFEPGDTTGDAELKDIRKPAAGFTVPANANAGDAVRAQVTQLDGKISELKGDLADIVVEVLGKNLFDLDKATVGALQSDGSISTVGAWANYKTSDYIYLEGGKDYVVSYRYSGELFSDRIISEMYDLNKNKISDSYINDSSSNNRVFSPTTDCYVRVSVIFSTSDPTLRQCQFEQGNTPTSYEDYCIELKYVLHDDEKVDVSQGVDKSGYILKVGDDGKVAPTIDEFASVIYKIKSKNLFDLDKATVGALQSDGSISTVGAWGNYKTSDYIPIEANVSYVLSIRYMGEFLANRLIYALYDSNKKLLVGSYVNDSSNSYKVITSTVNGYVRVAGYFNSSNSYTYQLEKGNSPTDYESYKAKIYTTMYIEDNKIPNRDILHNKKWCPCGDSFTEWTTETFEGGEFDGKYKTYPYLIAQRTGIKIESKFFASGRTMAYPSDGTFSNSLTCPSAQCYYQNIPEDADYITIMLGINDVNHLNGSGTTSDGEDATGVITLGTIDDTTTSTYYGAYNTVLSWLRENRPFAHIGIIVTNGTEREEWTNAQIELAKKYGYPYINLNGDERTPAMIRTSNPNMSNELKTLLKQKQASVYPSNTHPNAQAHEYESQFIEAWLRTL